MAASARSDFLEGVAKRRRRRGRLTREAANLWRRALGGRRLCFPFEASQAAITGLLLKDVFLYLA